MILLYSSAQKDKTTGSWSKYDLLLFHLGISLGFILIYISFDVRMSQLTAIFSVTSFTSSINNDKGPLRINPAFFLLKNSILVFTVSPEIFNFSKSSCIFIFFWNTES